MRKTSGVFQTLKTVIQTPTTVTGREGSTNATLSTRTETKGGRLLCQERARSPTCSHRRDWRRTERGRRRVTTSRSGRSPTRSTLRRCTTRNWTSWRGSARSSRRKSSLSRRRTNALSRRLRMLSSSTSSQSPTTAPPTSPKACWPRGGGSGTAKKSWTVPYISLRTIRQQSVQQQQG